MPHQSHEPASTGSSDRTTKRRDLLKAAAGAGGALVVVGGSTGTAVAGDTPDEIYFCGCSQVVITGLSRTADVTVYLRRTESGGCATATPSRACFLGNGREHAYRYTYSDGEAILAVEAPDGNIICNPNTCAEKWLESLECFDIPTDTLSGSCTGRLDPPAEIYTNKCGTVCTGNSPSEDNGNAAPADSRGPENHRH